MRKTRVLVGGALVCAAAAVSSQAAVISAGPSPSLNVTTAPGTLGSAFPDVGATGGGGFLTTPPPNTLGTMPTGITLTYNTLYSFSGGSYSHLTVNGTSIQTGFTWTGAGTSAAPNLFATLSIGAGAPSSFTMGLLTNNTDSIPDDTAFVVASGSSSASTATNLGGTAGESGVNDFYYVNVTGAVSGDTITISGYNRGPAGNAGLAGITFSTLTAVPEPGSIGLIGGLITLCTIRRKTPQS